jgi:hypothetical protein
MDDASPGNQVRIRFAFLSHNAINKSVIRFVGWLLRAKGLSDEFVVINFDIRRKFR